MASHLRWGRRELVAVGGVRIHVETAGPEGGPTLVGLHGFASGTFTWAGIAEALAGELRVVAWDRPPLVAEALGADLHLVEGAGHAPHEQRPEVVAEVIRSLLRSIQMGDP